MPKEFIFLHSLKLKKKDKSRRRGRQKKEKKEKKRRLQKKTFQKNQKAKICSKYIKLLI